MQSETMETTPEVSADVADVLPVQEALPVDEAVDETARLAEDFLILAQEFPQFIHPSQVPDAVLDMAVEQGISLLDAYLRHRLMEEKKVAAAQQKRQQAAECSAGSLARGAVQTPPEQDAFLRAFRAAI